MRLRDLGLLVLSLLIVGWGMPATARADDVQQSHYSVALTKPPATGTSDVTGGGAGATIDGNDGDTVTGNDNSGSSSTSPATNTNGGQGATVSPTNGKVTRASQVSHHVLAGRLPQTSEVWFGFSTLAGIILLLLAWIGILLKRRKQQN